MTEAFNEQDKTPLPKTRKEKIIFWLKRFGVAGFIFFLLKGLVWLALIFGVTKVSCF
jgi:hypothetical protein